MNETWLNTVEAARLLHLTPATLQRWAATGQIQAVKRRSGGGRRYYWLFPRAAVLRVLEEGPACRQAVPLPPREEALREAEAAGLAKWLPVGK